jgi:DNA-binding response OmpR family regulator
VKLNRYNILLVEDDINLGFLLLEFLQSHDFDVKLFRDGEGGYNAFKNNHFDFCIFDIMLPGMDGMTLAARIKKLNEKPRASN